MPKKNFHIGNIDYVGSILLVVAIIIVIVVVLIILIVVLSNKVKPGTYPIANTNKLNAVLYTIDNYNHLLIYNPYQSKDTDLISFVLIKLNCINSSIFPF